MYQTFVINVSFLALIGLTHTSPVPGVPCDLACPDGQTCTQYSNSVYLCTAKRNLSSHVEKRQFITPKPNDDNPPSNREDRCNPQCASGESCTEYADGAFMCLEKRDLKALVEKRSSVNKKPSTYDQEKRGLAGPTSDEAREEKEKRQFTVPTGNPPNRPPADPSGNCLPGCLGTEKCAQFADDAWMCVEFIH